MEYFPTNSTIIQWSPVDSLTHTKYRTHSLYWLFFRSEMLTDKNTVFSGHAIYLQRGVLRCITNKIKVIQTISSNITQHRQNPVQQERTLNV